MAQIKTQPTDAAVDAFIDAVEHPVRRADARVIDAMMRHVTGEEPVMWGPTIIGYGQYQYCYATGHEGDMCRIGFSPRKASLSLYLLGCDDEGANPGRDALLARLGKHRRGAVCLYVNTLADIDLDILEQLARQAWDAMEERYPSA